ncbi:MAG: hypothetical protein IJJ96_05840 [Bacteroidales bacterium]|nr:hypothetical protein [Bacteroidales bacterium]
MKKIVSILLLTVVSSLFASAQFRPVFPTTSGNQKIVETALKEALCVMKTEFQLEDTVSHERFNLEGKDFFGYSEGLCVKTNKGWISPMSVVSPWESNPDVKKYPEYKPVLSLASVLNVQDTTWSAINIKQIGKMVSIPLTQYQIVEDTDTFGEGLSVGKVDKSSDGWIVWVCRAENKVTLKAYSHVLSISDSTSYDLGYKVVPDNALGGIYVGTAYPSPGEVRFELLGMLANNEDEWGIVLLDAPSQTPVLSPDKPKLVPAGDKKVEATSAAVPKEKKNKKNKKQ